MNKLSTKALFSYWTVFKTMLRIDFEQARETFVSKMIDRFVWVFSSTVVAAYLLQSFGMTAEFGKFMLVGLIVSVGVMDAYSAIALMVADLDGDKVISYYLTLPIPPSFVFIRILVYYGLYPTTLGIFLFPICNFFLPEPIAYASINWPKSLLMIILINFFHASLTLWAATLVQDMRMLAQIWSRLLHPLWFLGGYQFTWASLCEKSPFLGKVALLNPLVHCFEGMRGAVLGGKEFLPFWVTASMLIFFIIVMTAHAIARFKKRLDLV